jgi:hypothetical protein
MINEPMTMATDYLLSVVSFGLGIHLLYARRLLIAGLAFFAIAFAALAGGAYHGLVDFFDESILAPLFQASLVSIGVSNFLLVIAVLNITAPKQNRRPWVIILAIQLLVYLFWVARSTDFRAAICDYAVTLAMILWVARNGPPAFVRPLRAGILVSLAASAVQLGHVTPAASFNHNDLYHVMQIGAVVLFHRAFVRATPR